MKRIKTLLSFFALSALFAGVPEAQESGMREWTVLVEKKIKGEFVRVEGDKVVLRTPSGKIRKGKIDKLTSEDQARVRKLAQKQQDSSERGGDLDEKFRKMFGDELLTTEGEDVDVEKLAGKTVGAYFSAHWCPPCRKFTPELVKIYKEWKKEGKDIEIVFVSRDRGEDEMEEYMEWGEMPWLAIPYESEKRDGLVSDLNVQGIPKLIIFNSKGEIITRNGRGFVSKFGTQAPEKWGTQE